MRPLKLKISAFKSYGGKEEIDFEKLGNDGIYLITGKTGAGKTTIFDAISFALFGSPSGKIDEVSTLRSKYAQEDIPTFIELTFSYKNKIYYIKRNPSYERKSKRGKFETVTEASKVEFHLPNGKILTKKNEVNEKIKDILGVNEIQFRQICMIAQGAFAKFLFAKTPEKESIFREIFKTANYETLEKKMKEKYKKVEDEDKLLTEQIKSFKERVECSKDFESDFFEENKKNIDFSEFLNELILFQEEKNKKLKSGIEDIETNKKIVEKNLDIAKEIEIKKEKLEELKKEKSEEEINFENYKKNLEKHANEENKIYELNTRKEIIKNDLEKYSELKNLEDEKSDLEKLVFEKENKKDDLKNQIELESKKLEILKEKKESLEKSSRNIFKLESQLEELKNQIEKLEELKKLFEDYCEKKENKKNYEAEVQNLEKIENKILDEIKKNNNLLKNKEEEFTKFETIEKNFADFSLKKNKISNDLKNLENLKTLNSEISKTSIEYNLKLKEFKESQESYEAQDKISRNLRKIYNSNQAGFLAKTLIENKPCPVCGSKVHPKPAFTLEIENINLEEVEEEEKKSKEIFLKMNELSANCGEILKEIEVKKKNLQKNLRDFFEIENIEKEKIGEWIVNKFSSLKYEMKKIDDVRYTLSIEMDNGRNIIISGACSSGNTARASECTCNILNHLGYQVDMNYISNHEEFKLGDMRDAHNLDFDIDIDKIAIENEILPNLKNKRKYNETEELQQDFLKLMDYLSRYKPFEIPSTNFSFHSSSFIQTNQYNYYLVGAENKECVDSIYLFRDMKIPFNNLTITFLGKITFGTCLYDKLK